MENISFGKYKGKSLNTIISKDIDYCIWLIKNIKYNLFSKNQLKEIEIRYYQKYGEFPFKLLYTAENLKYCGVFLKNLNKENLQLCYNDVPNYRWAIKLIHKSRKTQLSRSYPIFQSDDII